ncbi:RHS repeat protein, partial [Escherichia coli]|nr:RHS repeat protein [Escherichia coli]
MRAEIQAHHQLIKQGVILSTRQMTWSRYGQLLAFTDCSGYQTRYEYDRFGQMTAVHREEGISHRKLVCRRYSTSYHASD